MGAGVANGRVNLGNRPLLVNDNGRPFGILTIGHQHAKLLCDLPLVIGQKREVKVFLLREFFLVSERVGADADYDGVELSKLLNAVAKSARLGRSATGQCFGVEIKNDVLLPLKVFEVKGLGILLIG